MLCLSLALRRRLDWIGTENPKRVSPLLLAVRRVQPQPVPQGRTHLPGLSPRMVAQRGPHLRSVLPLCLLADSPGLMQACMPAPQLFD